MTTSVAISVRGDGALADAVRSALIMTVPADTAAVIVPRVPEPAPLAELTDEHLAAEVGDALDAVLADVQAALPVARLVFVLPADPVMGISGGAAASAVTNAVLSMARTLAIELARDGTSVNVLAVGSTTALQAQLAALLGEGGRDITGQEVYLTGGTDLGRVHP